MFTRRGEVANIRSNWQSRFEVKRSSSRSLEKKRVEAYHVSHWVCTYLLCKWCTEWLCHKDFHAYWWKMQIGGSFKLQSYWCISWLSRIGFFNKVNIVNILCRQTCMVQTVVKKTLLFWQMQRELIGKIVQPNQLVWMFI